jgi:GGDEF domain-containing protein
MILFMADYTSMPPGLIAERSLMLIALAQQAGREVCGKDLLSLSLGAAFYPKDGSDTDKLLAEADRRMYAAKRFHYDQVELIPPGVPQLARLVVVN